ncbi:MAG TPA: TadE family protein [Acidobacteriaceae bacterium]|nr:TadE family protein [Acidobacteriaceae bacterium]
MVDSPEERQVKAIDGRGKSMKISGISRGLVARARQLGTSESSGQALLEFALISPLILMLALGVFIFGIGLNEQLVLTNATEVAAQQLSVSRGQAYTSETPTLPTVCELVEESFVNAAPSLNQANLGFSLTISGQSSINDGNSTTGGTNFADLSTSNCSDALTENQTLTLTVTYPFTASFINFGTKNYTLTSTVQEVIE